MKAWSGWKLSLLVLFAVLLSGGAYVLHGHRDAMTSPAPPTEQTQGPARSSTPRSPSPVPSTQRAPSALNGSIPPEFPQAGNTGAKGPLTRVGPGGLTSGPGWVYDDRGWVSAGPGARLEGLDIPYNVDVVGDDVVVKNSSISVGGDVFGISIRHARNTLVEDSTISWDGKNRLLVAVKDIYGDATETVLRRVDISGTSTGVQIEDGLIEDCYIHDPMLRDGDHINGTTSNGGSKLLTIRHNTILNPYPQTDAISLFQDFSVQANRTIERNYLAGGGYVIYGGGGSKGDTRNIKIRNNVVSSRYFPRGGFYGTITYFFPEDEGNEWSGNVWADGPDEGEEIAVS